MTIPPLFVRISALALTLSACTPARDGANPSDTSVQPASNPAETTPEPTSNPSATPVETAASKDADAVFAPFLPWPSERSDIITRPSGLQYIVLNSGPADGISPRPTDRVTVHYDGRIAKGGAKFDSSFDRGEPATFPAGRLIAGWVEALQLMRPGDEWMLYIPTNLGYGQNPRPGGVIQPGDDLIFRVQMLSVTQMPAPDEAAWSKYTPWDPSREGIIKTNSGLQYVVLAPAPAGAVKPTAKDRVAVHYEGRLASNGEFFDSSFSRGEPAVFPVGGVIPGWTEVLQLMSAGERVLVFIPSALAYGATGTPGGPIPPNADLIFEVSLLDVISVR
jgi:FKBP-type peptidyl-prolyl cis-trans isomerase